MSAVDTVITSVRKLAEDVSAREGCYLYDIEFVGSGQGRVLRVTIDKDGENGVSVEDCTNVSRGMNLILDVEDVVPGGNYNLEVSSPGLERVLKEPRHYDRAVGKTISLKSFAPLLQFNEQVPELGKAKSFEGKLLGHDDKGLTVAFPVKEPAKEPADGTNGALQDENGGFYKEVSIPFETITKAHTVFVFEEKMKPGQKTGGKNSKKPKTQGGNKK